MCGTDFHTRLKKKKKKISQKQNIIPALPIALSHPLSNYLYISLAMPTAGGYMIGLFGELC
jgi:hypothetical protein